MKDISSQLAVDANTLSGKIDGTVIATKEINDPMVQFFQKLLDIASIVPNGDDENESNGYQLIEALTEAVRLNNLNGLKPITLLAKWNMDTDIAKTITHGLTTAQFRAIFDIKVMITKNDASELIPLDYYGYGGFKATATNIELTRLASPGLFDSADFDGTPVALVYNTFVTIYFKEGIF